MQNLVLTEVVPIIATTVPRTCRTLGAEDAEELVQDTVAAACQAVHDLEQRGKPVVPKSVVWFAVQRAESGRRSTSAGRTDAMSPGCALDGNAQITSMDAPLPDCDNVSLHDVLSGRNDDPGDAAVRRLDWDQFMAGLDARENYVVQSTAVGSRGLDQARALGVSAPRIVQLKRGVAEKARQFWGDEVIADAVHVPQWKRDLWTRRA